MFTVVVVLVPSDENADGAAGGADGDGVVMAVLVTKADAPYWLIALIS